MRKKEELFLIAGVLWTLAGSMVCQVGIKAWCGIHSLWINIALVLVFLVFYQLIFSKLVMKQEKRIMSSRQERLPWWQFFDRRSYVIMAVMMSGGMLIRLFQLLPIWFFSFFYTGLGAALVSAGLRFVFLFWKYRSIQGTAAKESESLEKRTV